MSASRRVTISDVAREAGVSIGAVSAAVNGRKGVSDATRARIVEVADRLGWTPDPVARSLTGARTMTAAVVLGTKLDALAASPTFTSLVAAIGSRLSEAGYAMQLQADPAMDADLDTHRRWLRSQQVDGVVLVDLRSHDPRIEAMRGLPDLPAVVVSSGDPAGAEGLPTVWIDEAAGMRDAVALLHRLGHRSLALVARPVDRAAAVTRDRAFLAACADLDVDGRLPPADAASGGAAATTRSLLSSRPRPTAVIFDGQDSTVAGLGAALEAGVPVPGEVSLLGWYDAPLYRATYPQLTAVGFDAHAAGTAAADLLLALLRGGPVPPDVRCAPSLQVRGSTGPPPIAA